MFFIMFTSSYASEKHLSGIRTARNNNKTILMRIQYNTNMTHLIPMILIDRHVGSGIVRDRPC